MSEIAFPAEGTELLRELAANNDREWFSKHKSEIEAKALRPAEALVAELTERLEAQFGGSFRGKVFRLHRDLRFTKDKTPYTPYVRIALSRADGECEGTAVVYLSFEVDRVVVGAGVWEFDSEMPARFRQRAEEGTLDPILERLTAAGARISEPELARTPKGLPVTAHSRRKGLTVWFETEQGDVPTDVQIADIAERIQALSPLVSWLSHG